MSKKKTKPVQTHVLIDNNILIRVVSQSASGNEFSLWVKLTDLVKAGKVHLILPEVIQLEFESFARTAKRDFEAAMEHFAKFEFKKNPWNETDQLKEHLKSPINDWQDKTWKEWEVRIHKVQSWLKDQKNSTFVGLLDAMVALKKRRITKRMPPKPVVNSTKADKDDDDRDKDSDFLILESAVLSFDGKTEQKQILICTDNQKDFRATDKSDVVHLPFGEDLPLNRLFKDLKSLLDFIDEGKVIAPLTEDEIEDIEESVQRSIVEELFSVDLPPSPLQENESPRFLPSAVSFNESNKMSAFYPDMSKVNVAIEAMNKIPDLSKISAAMEAMNKIPDMSKINAAMEAASKFPPQN